MSRTLPLAAPLLAATLASACSAAEGNAAAPANVAVETGAPASNDAQKPEAAPAPAGDLSAYAGLYPNDAVGGVAFVDNRLVSGAVARSVPDTTILTRILSQNSTSTPIVPQGTRLLSGACEPHNCGDHNWTIIVEADGSAAEICYHDSASMGGSARWYSPGGAAEMRDGDCPSE